MPVVPIRSLLHSIPRRASYWSPVHPLRLLNPVPASAQTLFASKSPATFITTRVRTPSSGQPTHRSGTYRPISVSTSAIPMATTSISPDDTIVIVGAGIFGASTALHLIRAHPRATIKLLDREPYPCQLAASWDWNKIIRAEYSDLFYMKLALEAKKCWEKDPLWQPFYHQSGGVWIQDTDLAGVISENYRTLGMTEDVKTYSVDEARRLYGGLFENAEFEGIERVLVSSTTGWAEAGKALAATVAQAVREGVQYLQGNVVSLAFDKATNDCFGVNTAAAETVTGSKVILCTGAGTAKLLADSAPHRKELHAGKRFIAAGMCTALMTPEPEACAKYKDVPIVLHERLHYEGRGGFIPPTPDGNFKWWADITFSNYTIHEPSGEEMSIPPSGPYQGQWDVPQQFHREMQRAKQVIFGSKADELSFDKYRLCWDAMSPSDDWFVTPHPASENLYIATVGSWHSYKFLPTVGAYVVKMLEGQLDDEQRRRWAWDREQCDDSGNQYWPRRDWTDIVKATKL